MGKLWFDNRCSIDFGIIASGSGTFNAPERDVSMIEIPGRNGNLIIDNHRFKNISVSYPAFITKNFTKNSDAARLWLLATSGYKRLEDDYHPDYYRMAQFMGPIDFDMRFLNWSGETQLTFDCKPQRFLKSGDNAQTVANNSTIYNDWMPSLPMLEILGSGDGEIIIGQNQISITGLDGNMFIDCDTQNAYYNYQNLNNKISIFGNFPILDTGPNKIIFSGGIQTLKITPRWWTI